MNSDILEAMSKISNYCADQNCRQCPLFKYDTNGHQCDIRNYIPENWRYLIDSLRDKGKQ